MSSKVFCALILAVSILIVAAKTASVVNNVASVSESNTQVKPEPTPTHAIKPTLKSVNGTVAPTKTQTTSSANHLRFSYIACGTVLAFLLL